MKFIIDGHLDVAMNALMYRRDQKLSVVQLRQREQGLVTDRRGTASVSFAQMHAGGIGLFVGTVIARSKPGKITGEFDWPMQEMAFAVAQGQLAYYHEMQRQGELRIIADRKALDHHWTQATTSSVGVPLGVIIMMEGADPIVEPDQVHAWSAQGLRLVSLAHYGHSHYACGTPPQDPNSPEKDGPLTVRGKALLKEMQKLPMAVDLTHLSDLSFFDTLDHYSGPVCATHSNARTLANNVRQLTDAQIKLIIERDGVMGMAMHNGMIRWIDNKEPAREHVGLEHVVQHIDHICQIAGNANHVALGSDMDGGFGTESMPREIDTIADLKKIGPLLKARGYSDADVEAFFHGNWLRFWRRVLPQ